MTYATVMVGLSIDQPNEARLEIAGQLAERLRRQSDRNYRSRIQSAALFHVRRTGPKAD